MFDVVIPLGPNELSRFSEQLFLLFKNVIGFRDVFVVTYDVSLVLQQIYNSDLFVSVDIFDRIHVVSETIFPFSMQDIASVFHPKTNRNGWYLQQLLKLYAGSVLPDILSDYLVVDADVFFLKPVQFLHSNTKKPFMSVGQEYHIPYFQHMLRLNPCFKRMIEYSGINHHMYFKQDWIQEMFSMVETCYRNHNHCKPFWKLFLECVDEHLKHPIDYLESGASEYELYFHFVMQFHKNDVVLRTLNWDNKPYVFPITESFIQSTECDFISICHWYNG
jgi:hypothetical protein